MNTLPKNKTAGFIRGQAFLSLLALAVAMGLLYVGSTWGRAYYIKKMSLTCSERMWAIENAKEKYRKKAGGTAKGTIGHYSELLPFLPFTGFPMCPWGGEFSNKLSLDKQVTCPMNGKTEYEPETPGVNLMRNGYNDLSKEAQSVSFFDYFHNKATWKNTSKDPNSPKKPVPAKKSPFES